MKHAVLGFVLSVCGLSIVAAAQAPGAQVIEVEKLRPNLFLFKGGGGNTIVFIRSDSVAIVDSKNPGWGQAVKDKVRELTDKPITTIINTHAHADHVSGNVEFPGVEIVAQANTRVNMQTIQDAEYAGTMKTGSSSQPQTTHNIFKANNGRGLPTKTFKDKMSLGTGPDRIDLYYFGRGHTSGDAWVVFPALGVMHAGDMFPGPRFTNTMSASTLRAIGTDYNGGSSVELVETLARAVAGIKGVDTIVCGHDPRTFTFEELKDHANFTREWVTFVREAQESGKSIDEAAKSWKQPPQYPAYKLSPELVERSAREVFIELNRSK